jgi:hypothetical protein
VGEAGAPLDRPAHARESRAQRWSNEGLRSISCRPFRNTASRLLKSWATPPVSWPSAIHLLRLPHHPFGFAQPLLVAQSIG